MNYFEQIRQNRLDTIIDQIDYYWNLFDFTKKLSKNQIKHIKKLSYLLNCYNDDCVDDWTTVCNELINYNE